MLNRGRRSVGLDLKQPEGVETLLKLVDEADALIEGFRPGVAERLGVGPDICLAPTPARLRAHDRLGAGRPVRPDGRARHQLHLARRRTRNRWAGPVRSDALINLIGDFGGGGMLLASAWPRP